MSQIKDIVFTGFAVVGGATLLKEGATAATNRTINNITYTTGKPVVDLKDIGLGNVGVKLPINILNENVFSITIDKFMGAVSYGMVPIGLVQIPNNFTLPSGEVKGIDLHFIVEIKDTVSGVFNAVNSASSILNVVLEKLYLKGELFILGNTFLGQFKIPIETTIQIV